MQALAPDIDLERFFTGLRAARERVLFLDYDGTLAPFKVRPEHALPYPGVAPLLNDLRAKGTRIVLVSGRCLEDLGNALQALPVDEVWASHGWQRRGAAGDVVHPDPALPASHALARAQAAAAALAANGARVERKVASVAVHWRGLPAASAHGIRARLENQWTAAPSCDVHVLPFDGGMEMRARGRDKGDAVREVLAACPAGTACAYLGDDLTDEDAFAALEGIGLGVLVRSAPRATRAHVWVRPPVGLLTFLHRWRNAIA